MLIEGRKNDKPGPPGSMWLLLFSGCILAATTEPKPFTDSESIPRGGAEKMTSRYAGSVKQLFPVSSNFWHLARVLLIKARATCFETLVIPLFEAQLARVACYVSKKKAILQSEKLNLLYNLDSNCQKVGLSMVKGKL